MKKGSNNTTNLGRDKIGGLLLKLSLPAIIAQLVNLLYNMVDRIFIGQMPNGEIAIAGIGVAFPVIIIISAFSALVGMGGAPLAAIKMGQGDDDAAEEIMTNSFSALIIISIILTLSVLIFKKPILQLFGASPATLGYAMDYLGIYVLGTISVQIALGLNPFINTQGFAKTGMMSVMIGAIINIILDAVFIIGLDMGIKGAALATIIAQSVSAIWILYFLLSKRTKLKIRKKYLMPKWKIIKDILALGVSPFVMQGTESLVLISFNNMLSMYGGDLAIGAMTIMSSIMQIIILPLIGLSQGAQPIISYNYGAKQIDRVKETFKLLFKISLTYTSIICLLLMLVPQMFVVIFNNNPEFVQFTSWSIRIYFAGIFAFGAQIACQQTFLALGQAKISLILALLRKIILLIPLIFILPQFMDNKLFAVLLAEPIADLTAAIVTTIVFTIFYKKTLGAGEREVL